MAGRSRFEGAFVGCNVNLISPVRISGKAFLAAGSTITQDVPEDALGVARSRQRNLDGWVARKEGRSGARADSATPSAPDGAPTARAPEMDAAGETPGHEPGFASERGSGRKK